MQPFMTNAWGVGGVPKILNPLEYDVPQAPKPSSSGRKLLPMVSFATKSLFVHLFTFGGIMPRLHGKHLGNIGVTSMGMGWCCHHVACYRVVPLLMLPEFLKLAN